MKGLIVMKEDSLGNFEPENEETNWQKIIISSLLATGLIAAIIYVILTNLNKVGTLK